MLMHVFLLFLNYKEFEIEEKQKSEKHAETKHYYLVISIKIYRTSEIIQHRKNVKK